VTNEDLMNVLYSLKKDKIQCLDGWNIEFFLVFCDLAEEDLLIVIEEVKILGRMPGCFDSTFIEIILKKKKKTYSFDEFRPISLCNCIYKIIEKMKVVSFKSVLLGVISLK
jgi:hypothetical protein